MNGAEVGYNIMVGDEDGMVDYVPSAMEKSLTRTVAMLREELREFEEISKKPRKVETDLEAEVLKLMREIKNITK